MSKTFFVSIFFSWLLICSWGVDSASNSSNYIIDSLEILLEADYEKLNEILIKNNKENDFLIRLITANQFELNDHTRIHLFQVSDPTIDESETNNSITISIYEEYDFSIPSIVVGSNWIEKIPIKVSDKIALKLVPLSKNGVIHKKIGSALNIIAKLCDGKLSAAEYLKPKENKADSTLPIFIGCLFLILLVCYIYIRKLSAGKIRVSGRTSILWKSRQ